MKTKADKTPLTLKRCAHLRKRAEVTKEKKLLKTTKKKEVKFRIRSTKEDGCTSYSFLTLLN